MEKGTLVGGARRLATSSAALLVLVAVIGVVVMNLKGRVDGQQALDFIKWIVIAYITKVAVEDGASKLMSPKTLSSNGTGPILSQNASVTDTEKTEPGSDSKSSKE